LAHIDKNNPTLTQSISKNMYLSNTPLVGGGVGLYRHCNTQIAYYRPPNRGVTGPSPLLGDIHPPEVNPQLYQRDNYQIKQYHKPRMPWNTLPPPEVRAFNCNQKLAGELP
jgi:hypothetical protein